MNTYIFHVCIASQSTTIEAESEAEAWAKLSPALRHAELVQVNDVSTQGAMSMNESKPFIKIDNTYYPVNGIMFTVWETDQGLRATLSGIGGVEEPLDTFRGKQAEVIRDWLEKESLNLTAEEDA